VVPKTKQDREWEAQNDADTLARAQEISTDKVRMKRALIQSQKKAVLAVKVDEKLRKVFG
jgi:hypothetical protein